MGDREEDVPHIPGYQYVCDFTMIEPIAVSMFAGTVARATNVDPKRLMYRTSKVREDSVHVYEKII